MSMLTPEIASLFGALDSNAVEDGSDVSARFLRPLAMSVNRLLAKGHTLCNLIWPNFDAATDADKGHGAMSGIARARFERLHPPVACYKKPGLTKADLSVRVNVTSGETIQLQVVTLGLGGFVRQTFGANPVNVKTITGTGAFDQFTLNDIPIDPGPFERVEFWVRGTSRGALGNETTYGANNKGTLDQILRNRMEDQASTWNDSRATSTNYAAGGHYLLFVDGNDNPITAARNIFAVSNTFINFEPDLSVHELQAVEAFDKYEIRTLPRWAFSNIALFAQGRTA